MYYANSTVTQTIPWGGTTTITTSTSSTTVSQTALGDIFAPDPEIAKFAEAARRAAHILALTEEALARWRRLLRRSVVSCVQRVRDARPSRTCSLATSWQAQGPP